MRDLSRRTLLRAAPTAAVLAAVPAAAVPVTAAIDPYVAYGADYLRHWHASNNSPTDEEADAHFALWGYACDGLVATRPTTLAGVLAGLRVTLSEYRDFIYPGRGEPDGGDRLMVATLEGAIAVLEREIDDA